MSFGLDLRADRRVFAGFAIYSFSMGNIFPRLPDIKRAMDIQEGALGLGLIGVPVGTLVSLTLAAPLLDKIGYRKSLLALIPLVALTYAIAVQATGPLGLFFLLIPVGLMIGGTEIILNVEADRTEAQLGRRIMNRAHSFWSIGFFAAGMFGSLMALGGIPVQLHLAFVVVIAVIGTYYLLGTYQPAPARPLAEADAAPMFSMPTRPILLLVAVTLSAMLMEGASLDWSAIYMRSVFDSSAFVAGMAVATFAFFQATARFFVDSFVERYSPHGVAQALLVFMSVGLVLVVFSPGPAVSLPGFALLGLGTSAIFPLAISAAAQRTDRSASVNVAAVAQTSFVIFLLGPPLLGFIAEHLGLRYAYAVGIPLVVLSFFTSGALGKKPVPATV
ncbi:MFS transporter [Pelagovum pacificum]|uniref:MFS transporter n=1 Tax=Pelagovum pacificum TaxID=2588711 RepID=A0A5C5GDK9_9RHOB|nr:MFS transporter [Pelagovum pacificum]QQA42574.1 MFS transporter [Pelagovum pacificum]TNY31659.1 MFS transporter [Pelagovum pacificum]